MNIKCFLLLSITIRFMSCKLTTPSQPFNHSHSLGIVFTPVAWVGTTLTLPKPDLCSCKVEEVKS